jgi:hypothetical protein
LLERLPSQALNRMFSSILTFSSGVSGISSNKAQSHCTSRLLLFHFPDAVLAVASLRAAAVKCFFISSRSWIEIRSIDFM